jgi:hypothetical protein
LSRARWVALGGLLLALVLYDALAGELPALGERWDVVSVSLVVLPAAFAVAWLLLPARGERWVLPAALALAAASVLLYLAGLGALFNTAKLAALVLFGFWFLSLFEHLSFVVLVASIVPVVDAISVWRGPTEYVVEEQPGIFDRISVAFRVPGEDGSANLGPPDVIFFALFLGAAARFALRPGWTWLAMTGLLALTLIGTVVFDVRGLPALPAVCLGFLAANADLLWRELRTDRLRGRATGVRPPGSDPD